MSRIELNLWDAHTIDMKANEITIETEGLQVHLILPKDTELPDWGFHTFGLTTVYPEEIPPIICNHAPIMHRLSGGCNAPGCICTRSRSDESCEKDN